jgi:hypothetical protein
MRLDLPRVAARAVALAAALAALVASAPARAADPSFTIELDREAVAPGEPFICQVTLNIADEQVDSYRAPDFKGLRVLSTPQYPTRSTQMQIGGGQTFVQNSYTWSYQLMVPPGGKGPVVIGGARARVGGRDLRSNTLDVRLGAPSGGGAAARRQAGGQPPSIFDMFGGREPQAEAPASSGGSFIRVVADKMRVFVGEPVVVTWSFCTNQQLPNKFDPTAEARTDGFWSEDLPSTAPKGRFAFKDETINGRPYQVATIVQKVLFPLRDGKLTITPLEADIAQVDFFGTAVREQHLKADPVTIEALPLPAAGRPAGFDAGDVGKYQLTMRADRTTVSVGEAVTVTVEVKGVGNVRNVPAPVPATPEGWKSYPPKETVALDAPGGVGGTKTAELLLLPERAGTVMVPSVTLPTFDPATKTYGVVKSEPLRLDVTGDATAGAAPHGPGGAAAGATVENVITAAIRPIRARSRLGRDVGTTFLRSRAFGWLLFLPPFAFGLTAFVERVRGRLASDTKRAQRRHVRKMVRQRLGAAEAHREAGRTTELYIEIDRVLREVLSARLGLGVSGLRRDELAALLAVRGMPADATTRILAELEACDQARFAPGGDPAGANAMAAALERADELIGVIEKAPLRDGGRA